MGTRQRLSEGPLHHLREKGAVYGVSHRCTLYIRHFFSYLVQSTIFYSRRPFSPPAVLCLRCEVLPGHQLGRHLVVICNYAVDASRKISRCPINVRIARRQNPQPHLNRDKGGYKTSGSKDGEKGVYWKKGIYFRTQMGVKVAFLSSSPSRAAMVEPTCAE